MSDEQEKPEVEEPAKALDPLLEFLNSESKDTEFVFCRMDPPVITGLCKETQLLKPVKVGGETIMQTKKREALRVPLIPFAQVSSGAGMDLLNDKKNLSINSTWGYVDVAELEQVKLGFYTADEVCRAIRSLQRGEALKPDMSDIFCFKAEGSIYPTRLVIPLSYAKDALKDQYEIKKDEVARLKRSAERAAAITETARKAGRFS